MLWVMLKSHGASGLPCDAGTLLCDLLPLAPHCGKQPVLTYLVSASWPHQPVLMQRYAKNLNDLTDQSSCFGAPYDQIGRLRLRLSIASLSPIWDCGQY